MVRLRELRLDPGERYSYISMDEAIQVQLLQKIVSRLDNQAIMRRQIAPHERLSVTLRLLATGRNCVVVRLSVAISSQTLGVILSETCTAMYEEQKVRYDKLINNKLSSRI
jgi:hypothetical protein